METFIEAHKKVFIEVISNSDEVRAEYLANYRDSANDFSLAMSQALTTWHQCECRGDPAAAGTVSSLAYAAIMLHIQSMKLFLSGCPVPAGTLSRQAVENIALALLCSIHGAPVLGQFMSERYAPRQALADMRSWQAELGLGSAVLDCLEKSQRFYSLYDHPTKMTVASYMSHSDAGLYIGAAFDEGKMAFYGHEMSRRLALAEVFPSLLRAIRRNLARWPAAC